MTPRAIRRVSRIIHLVAATALALLLYSPLGEVDAYVTATQLGTFPLLTVTGFTIWLAPRVIARRRRGAASTATSTS